MRPRRPRFFTTDSAAAERLRRMYAGGHADSGARAYARFWNRVMRLGLLPRRWVVLEVRGRRSGRLVRVPLGMARYDARWYLVSMLGECHWTRNVRAADGRAALLRVRRHPVQLTEVPVPERGPIIREYLQRVPGARPHMRVALDAPLEEFQALAPTHPVFAVAPREEQGARRRAR
ncbi:nitroreductase/quinone reductase family protein [Pseudonocardia sp.]|uniref:nitroreductase/quinone reductase family protein n=1 Tax=Pseudonocardia sp. TaxID=60912 RepID=UPI003D1314EF